VRSPRVKAERERLSQDGADYVEYVFKHRSISGMDALKWGYAEGSGQSRYRHTVIQVGRTRIEYRATVGHVANHIDQFRAAVRSSGVAG
jgi:hypothetical protein